MANPNPFFARRARLTRWDELLRFVQQHPAPRWAVRGHRQMNWKLRPSVGRTEGYSVARELQLFNEFKRVGRPMVDRSKVITDWDWLFLAQHHGLPTRLLDWTFNPLVAIYFACQPSPRNKRDGELIAVDIADAGQFGESDIGDEPFGILDTKFVLPTVVAPRIAAQKGLFSVHHQPQRSWRLRNQTQKHTIRADDKEWFLEFLFGMGVDAAMLMADLDGISANLAWRYNKRGSL